MGVRKSWFSTLIPPNTLLLSPLPFIFLITISLHPPSCIIAYPLLRLFFFSPAARNKRHSLRRCVRKNLHKGGSVLYKDVAANTQSTGSCSATCLSLNLTFTSLSTPSQRKRFVYILPAFISAGIGAICPSCSPHRHAEKQVFHSINVFIIVSGRDTQGVALS